LIRADRTPAFADSPTARETGCAHIPLAIAEPVRRAAIGAHVLKLIAVTINPGDAPGWVRNVRFGTSL